MVISEIKDAINAGTAEFPLEMHITVTNMRREPESASLVYFNTHTSWRLPLDAPGGTVIPCNVIMAFPEKSNTDPLLKLKKDLVKNMYHCVQHYHHRGHFFPRSEDTWWYEGTARFFDGIIWPTPPELVPAYQSDIPFDPNPRYPELYNGIHPLHGNNAAAALF